MRVVRYVSAAVLVLAVTGCSKACTSISRKLDPCAECKEGVQHCTMLAGGEYGCAPLRKLGESCEASSDCAGTDVACLAGKCAPRPKLGEACEPERHPEECIDSFCGAGKRCVPLGKVGEACFVSENCAGKDLFCKESRCAKRPKVGERCEPGECLDSFCGPAHTCAPAASAGESCGNELACNEGLFCLAVAEGGASRCYAPAAAGAPCVVGAADQLPHDNCDHEHFCDAAGKRICLPKLADNAPCTHAWQCWHGCSNGHCSPASGGAGFSRPHGL